MIQQPLQGLRVLDLTQIFQGPYCSFLMAMAGADVVKIEPKGGERLRRGGGDQTPLAFAMLNSNKRSLVLDLKDAGDKQLLIDMARKADVLLENFAPGTMDRLGLGWAVMKEVNPRLVYGTATGFGITGPARDQLAMDHTVQAFCGLMSTTGEADGPPIKAGGQICDIMGGIHLYGGVVSALLAREKTGRGTRVETAMSEGMYFALGSELSHLHRTGELPPRRGDKSAANIAPYGRYRCTDGWVAMLCVSEPQWERLAELVGCAELVGDPEYATGVLRHRFEAQLNEIIGNWTGTRSRDDVFNQLREARVPVAPIRNLTEVMGDEHMHLRGMLHDMHHPYMGDLTLPSSPLRYADYETSQLSLFPEPGADGSEVLKDWLDMSDEAIQARDAAD